MDMAVMCVSCAHLGRQSLALSKETHTHMHIMWSFARFGALNTQMSNAFIWTNNEKIVARAKFNIFLPLNICFCHLAPSHWQLTFLRCCIRISCFSSSVSIFLSLSLLNMLFEQCVVKFSLNDEQRRSKEQ